MRIIIDHHVFFSTPYPTAHRAHSRKKTPLSIIQPVPQTKGISIYRGQHFGCDILQERHMCYIALHAGNRKHESEFLILSL